MASFGPFGKEELERWRSVQLVQVAADRFVTNKPCFVFMAELVPLAAGASDAFIYDGVDATGDLRITLASITGDPAIESYQPPQYFAKGLFIDVDTNVQVVRVRYMIDPRT
jgi:hypothetical protein